MEIRRYLELMANEGVHFWGFSTGNEPLNGLYGWMFVRFMSLGWTAEAQVGILVFIRIHTNCYAFLYLIFNRGNG